MTDKLTAKNIFSKEVKLIQYTHEDEDHLISIAFQKKEQAENPEGELIIEFGKPEIGGFLRLSVMT